MKTTKQRKKEVVSFYKRYIRRHKFSPTYSEVAEELSLTRGRIGQLVSVLIDENKLERSNKRSRNIIIKKK